MQKFFGVMVLAFIGVISAGSAVVYAAADNVLITSVGSQTGVSEYGTVTDVTFDLVATGDSGSGDVTWGASGVPGGVSVSFSDNPSTGSSTWSTTLTLTASASVDPGSYIITVTADGDGVGAIDDDTLTYTIDPRKISGAGMSADDKEYDGTTSATTTGSLTDAINGDSISATGAFVDKTVGATKEVTLTLTGGDSAKYILNGSTTAAITAKDVTILTGDFATNGRRYDGSIEAELRGTPSGLTLSGVVPGDSVTIASGLGHFADKHRGLGKTVTFTDFVAAGTDGANYSLTAQPADETQNINFRLITVRPVNDTKVYDNATSSSLTPTVTSGSIAPGDTGVFTQQYDTATVGTGKTVISIGTVDDGNGGGNYTITHTPRTNSEITALELTVTGLSANTKIYDKTTSATLAAGGTLVGILGLDDVSPVFTGASGEFDDFDAGVGKSVTTSGITLSGTDSFNYTVAQPVVTGQILARPISVTAVTASKEYDATTTVAGTPALTAGSLVAGDTAVYTQEFANKNVGTNKTINPLTDITDGNSGANYDVTSISDTTGVITAKTLAVTATGTNKTYDATTTATVTYDDDRISGDSFTISGTATFADKNVDTGKIVSITGIALSGTDAGNYTPNSTTTATADITTRTLTVTIEGDNKVYDDSRNATITLYDDRISGDVVTVEYPTTGPNRPLFGGRHVRTGKTVTVGGLYLSGTDAGNYTLAATTVSDSDVEVTAAPLTIVFEASDKTYDATTTASISSSSISTVLEGDDVVTVSGGTAIFSDKNVGTGKTVTASGFTLGGADESDYSIVTVTSATASITAKTLVVTATSSDKVYDGTATAGATFSDDRISGDSFTISGTATFADKNVDTGKIVSITGITLSGTDAGNYTPNSTTTTTADITELDLTVTATGIDKVYDGTTAADVTLEDNRLVGDVLTATGTATFADATIGTAKEVTVVSITLSGTDALNYSVNKSATTSASITEIPRVKKSGGSGRIIRRPVGTVLGIETSTPTTSTPTTTSAYQFLNNLHIGMTNTEVIELHIVLIAKGFLQIPAPTGYFGPLTFAAVKQYQAANGIINTGFVGPLTRGALNAGL